MTLIDARAFLCVPWPRCRRSSILAGGCPFAPLVIVSRPVLGGQGGLGLRPEVARARARSSRSRYEPVTGAARPPLLVASDVLLVQAKTLGAIAKRTETTHGGHAPDPAAVCLGCSCSSPLYFYSVFTLLHPPGEANDRLPRSSPVRRASIAAAIRSFVPGRRPHDPSAPLDLACYGSGAGRATLHSAPS
jgi:hypothetical protein